MSPGSGNLFLPCSRLDTGKTVIDRSFRLAESRDLCGEAYPDGGGGGSELPPQSLEVAESNSVLLGLFPGVCQEVLHRDILESFLMGSLQHHQWSHPRLQGFFPTKGTEAPAIAGFQTRKKVFRSRGRKIIALTAGEGEKFLGHAGTDHVRAPVLWPRFALSISIKARYGVLAAALQGLPKYVERFVFHESSFLLNLLAPVFVKRFARLAAIPDGIAGTDFFHVLPPNPPVQQFQD